MTSEAPRPWTWTWDRLLVEPRRPQVIRERPNAPWFAVAAVCVGAFMGQLDASIVTVALPTLQSTFDASVGAVAWVGLSYLLVLVATVTAVGRFADMWGRKLLYVYGFVIFTLASVLCGLAPGLGWLCGFRALQAVGAAMLQANSLAIIVLVVPAAALGRAIGFQGAAQALGLALGPTVGGLLLSAGGWRLIFFVNVPFGVFGAVAAVLLVPRSRELVGAGALRLDGVGGVLPGHGGAVVRDRVRGDGRVGVAANRRVVRGGGRARRRFRVARAAGQGTDDDWVVPQPRFSTGIVSGMGSYLVMFGVFAVGAFLSGASGRIGDRSGGMELMVFPLAFGIVAPFAGGVADSMGARPLCVGGMALVTASLVIMGAVRPTTLGFLGLLAVIGVGMGLFTSPNNASIMRHARRAGRRGWRLGC